MRLVSDTLSLFKKMFCPQLYLELELFTVFISKNEFSTKALIQFISLKYRTIK